MNPETQSAGSLDTVLDTSKSPKHVAIIMDGNGRWAAQRGWPRTLGHAHGADRVKEIIQAAHDFGVKYLSLYCLSTENWNRPALEIQALMFLMKKHLASEVETCLKNNIRIVACGQLSRLPEDLQKVIQSSIEQTKHNTGLVLNFCISYGARAELTEAIQKIAHLVQEGKLNPSEVSEASISQQLYTKEIPDPDLVIRTSGEFRISNFMLWQSAYSEFYITETLWPDFNVNSLKEACLSYQNRQRRFGKI